MDGETEDPGDVFRIPDLWSPSSYSGPSPEYSSFFFSKLDLEDFDTKLPDIYPTSSSENPLFSCPELIPISSSATTTPLETVNLLDTTPEINEHATIDLDDVWLSPEEQPLQPAEYLSWNGFASKKAVEHITEYITESGPSVFDAAIIADEDHLHIANSDHIVVDTRIYMGGLLSLALGRMSTLFVWDEDKHSFRPNSDRIRVSGYSGESLAGSAANFLDCGNATRFLQSFVDKSYLRNQSPGQIALAEAVSSSLVAIQTQLSFSGPQAASILSLEDLLRPAHIVLTTLQRIVRSVSSARNDEAMFSTIFQEAQILENRPDALRDIVFQLLSRVTKPWFEFASEWLGVRREVGIPISKSGKSKGFVMVANREWVNEQGEELSERDFVLDYDRVPSFIAPEDARSLFEVGRCLKFLRAHHPAHPLSKDKLIGGVSPPAMEWRFSWKDIVEVERKALNFEKDLKSAIQNYSLEDSVSLADQPDKSATGCQSGFFGLAPEDLDARFLLSIATLNEEPKPDAATDDFSTKIVDFLRSPNANSSNDDMTLAPPLSLTPLLSFKPLISAQARIVNGTCLRMFFQSHNLRQHLRLQRDFHLFGNGVFSARLSHALFNPELESAERKKGVTRSGGMMGLRLGGRDTWPPASSELRLALMGILTESYVVGPSSKHSHRGTFLDETSLPGDLSFAVRDMSDDEIQKCLDPDSNEALDFLRLSYKPPTPLEAIITPVILFKYDQIFKLLLRILRMLFIATSLFRVGNTYRSSDAQTSLTAQRFRIEIQHFISCISGYFFETGVEATWRLFERKLDNLEEILQDDRVYSLGVDEGLDKFRDYHEMILDKIMSALLLRKRQQPVMKLLEEIFVLILRFFKLSRLQPPTPRAESENNAEADVITLYNDFREKTGVFVNVCRGLSEKRGFLELRPMGKKGREHASLFDGSDLAEESTISQLLTRLDMSGYYSKTSRS